MTTVKTKKCTGPCRLIKPFSEFHIQSKHSTGHNPRCKACIAISDALRQPEYYRKNKDRIKESNAKYYKQNKDKVRAQALEWHNNNKERSKARQAEYYKANSDSLKLQAAEYRRSHPEARKAMHAQQRVAKLQRTPAWADQKAVNQVYYDCEEINLAAATAGCSEFFVVDHIIPLQGKLVSGLHISSNLQIITANANAEKSNKFIPC